jgi:hypothetical protein
VLFVQWDRHNGISGEALLLFMNQFNETFGKPMAYQLNLLVLQKENRPGK